MEQEPESNKLSELLERFSPLKALLRVLDRHGDDGTFRRAKVNPRYILPSPEMPRQAYSDYRTPELHFGAEDIYHQMGYSPEEAERLASEPDTPPEQAS